MMAFNSEDPLYSPGNGRPAHVRPQWQTPEISVLSLTKTLAKGSEVSEASTSKNTS